MLCPVHKYLWDTQDEEKQNKKTTQYVLDITMGKAKTQIT
jgi:hypothetical protein